MKSAKELRKNPNAFFYRHVAPHEQQVRGFSLWTGYRCNSITTVILHESALLQGQLSSSCLPTTTVSWTSCEPALQQCSSGE